MSRDRYTAGPVKLARQLAYYRRRAEEVALVAETGRRNHGAEAEAGARLLDAEAERLLGEAGRVEALLVAGAYCRDCGRPLRVEESVAAGRGPTCAGKHA